MVYFINLNIRPSND